ncbi:MAG: hypothetical protein ACE5HX_16460 [bacterium]
MKPILIAGSTIVTFALISYTIAILTEQKKVQITSKVLIFLTTGITLDITATICMIIGSENTPFTLHGILGYCSLTAMLIDTILIWKFRITTGLNLQVPEGLHLYSRMAYAWWVMAYITGGLLVLLN